MLLIFSWSRRPGPPPRTRGGRPSGAARRPAGVSLSKTYCASCHDVPGQRPACARLASPTVRAVRQLAKRNGGVFPSARLRRINDGRDSSRTATARCRSQGRWVGLLRGFTASAEIEKSIMIVTSTSTLEAPARRPGSNRHLGQRGRDGFLSFETAPVQDLRIRMCDAHPSPVTRTLQGQPCLELCLFERFARGLGLVLL